MKTVTISAEFPEFRGHDRSFTGRGSATEWTSALSRAAKDLKKKIKHRRFTTFQATVVISESGESTFNEPCSIHPDHSTKTAAKNCDTLRQAAAEERAVYKTESGELKLAAHGIKQSGLPKQFTVSKYGHEFAVWIGEHKAGDTPYDIFDTREEAEAFAKERNER